MVIHFEGTIKSPDGGMYINTALFKLPSGSTVVIDRDSTRYSIDNGKFRMDWFRCYIWDGENQIYDIPDEFNFSELLSVEVEDDAPDDFEVSVDYAVWTI